MEAVMNKIEQLDLFTLIFDSKKLGKKTIESARIL